MNRSQTRKKVETFDENFTLSVAKSHVAALRDRLKRKARRLERKGQDVALIGERR